jgi:hypothetical protein
MKSTKTVSAPIVVTIPSTINKKMEAIVAMAHAVEDLAKAINSVNVHVNIHDVAITASDVGISVTTTD